MNPRGVGPDSAQLELGDALEQDGLLHEATAIDPERADVWVGLAALLREQGKLEEALDALALADDSEPESEEVAFQVGLVAYQQGDYDRAAEAWAQAASYSGGKSVTAYRNLGLALVQLDRKAEALMALRMSLRLGATADAYHDVAWLLHHRLSKVDDAVLAYQRSIETQPSGRAYHGLGVALVRLGKVDEAVEAYRSAVALEPTAAAWYDLGLALRSLHKLDDAAEAFDISARLEPRATTLRELGLVLRDLERFSEAIEAYKKAVAIDSSMSEALNELGLCLRADGRDEESFTMFLRAIEADPRDTYARLNLAEELRRRGRHQESRDQLDEVLEMEPGNELALTGLKRLEEGGDGDDE